MPKLVFYRQKRVDGAMRTGIELDGETLAERFDDAGGERDPALLWYVDLRCEGDRIPTDGDDAWRWLLDNSPLIRDGFARYADDLRAGADRDIYSLTWEGFQTVPPGVSLKIACSAIRRVDAREMSAILAGIGGEWEEMIQSIDAPESVEEIR